MKLEESRAEGLIAAISGVVSTGSRRQEYPVVGYEACIICDTCQRYCPIDAIIIRKDQEDCAIFTRDFCKGCGICANECPKACTKMMPVGGGK